MAWLEVETKVKVSDAKSLRNRIKRIATYVKTEKRGDDYFALKRKGYPKKAFRIRYNGKEYVVNFKKWLRHLYSKDIVVKEEFEFTLCDIEHFGNFLALFKDLGFEEWIKKIKQSESYRYEKDKRVTIELNKVKHLGYFWEIEYLCTQK